MKRTKYDRELVGPDSYEYYNNISKYCQKKYMALLKWQLILLLLISVVSTIPELECAVIEVIKQVFQVLCILLVLILMILQYHKDYMEGWQKARYLAESILSNCWLLVFKHDKYDSTYDLAIEKLHSRIKEMKNEIEMKKFHAMRPKVHADNDAPTWMKTAFDLSIAEKKEYYIKNRIDNQMSWYSSKAGYNNKNSSRYFSWGIVILGIGIVLTIFLLIKWVPSLSYLGLFTTISASIFSWKQTKRFDELKTTYSVSEDELKDFKKILLAKTTIADINDVVFDTEKAISREHKLWFSKVLD